METVIGWHAHDNDQVIYAVAWAGCASPAQASGLTQELADLAAYCTCLHLLAATGCRTTGKRAIFCS